MQTQEIKLHCDWTHPWRQFEDPVVSIAANELFLLSHYYAF